MCAEFRGAIESAEIGALVGPVESEFGYHILQVRSKEERSGAEIEAQIRRAKLQELELLREALREDQQRPIRDTRRLA